MDNRRIARVELDRPESRGPQGVAGDPAIVPVKDRAVESPEFARLMAAALRRQGNPS